MIELDSVSVELGGTRVLDEVGFSVGAGEWVALMGPSGSGKTTLINILGGLDTLTSGRVVVDGVELGKLGENQLVRYRAEKVGFVFQQFHLVPYLNALENVMLAQYFHSTTDEQEAAEALKRVGVETLPCRSTQDYNAGRTTQIPTGRVVGVRQRVRRRIGYNGFTLSFERVRGQHPQVLGNCHETI